MKEVSLKRNNYYEYYYYDYYYIFWVIITLDLVGGLFEETNSVEEIAFKYAVDHINRWT